MNRRILLLITDLQIGGTPRVVCELAARLHQPPDVSLHVACLAPTGPMAGEIQSRGVPVTPLNAGGPADLFVFRRLANLIRRERFDTVLSFLVHANVAAAAASLVCPGVHFMQSIQTTQPNPRWHWLAQRLATRAADKIVVPSASVVAAGFVRSGIPKEKFVIIPNGVELPPRITPSPGTPGEGRGEGFARPALPRIVFLGRLDPIKRLPDLLHAVALLNGFARLDIYGDGPERHRIEQKIKSLNLTPLVTFHGSIPNPAGALAAADLLVLPSEAEGFGLVLIEAMATGVPVVATDAPGIRDVVQHRQTGLLVPVGSPPALAAAIRWVLQDEELRQSLIAAARADVRRRFTWDAVIPQYRRLLRI